MVSTKREKPQATRNSDAAKELRAYAQRIVNLEDERKTLAGDIKDIKNEAAGRGYDKKALATIVARMRETPEERAARIEAEDIAEVYLASLGMLDGTPLGESARRRFDPISDSIGEDDGPAGEDEGGATSEGDREAPSRSLEAPTGAMSEETIAAAREEGGEAAAAGARVFANPYVAGDPRRAAWDEGWCARKGSDGMEIPDAWRRKKKPPAADEAADQDGQS